MSQKNIKKTKERRNKVLFINGVKGVTPKRAFRFLSDDNLKRLVAACFEPKNREEIAHLVDIRIS